MPNLSIEFTTEDLQVHRVSGFPLNRVAALGILAAATKMVNDALDAEEAKVVKPATVLDVPAGRLRHLNGDGA